ncbi:MAG: YcxB family protein [Chitinophagaceae bacterium]
MTVHFGYDKKQVLTGLRNHFFGRPEIRILIILVNVFAITSAILYYFKIIQPLSFLFFSLMWFLLWITVRRFLPYSIYKRSQTFKDEFTLSLNETEGVLLQTERGEQLWRWKDFSNFKETLYFFHLYFNSRSFFMIPKDSFKDLEEVQEARKIIKENVGKING